MKISIFLFMTIGFLYGCSSFSNSQTSKATKFLAENKDYKLEFVSSPWITSTDSILVQSNSLLESTGKYGKFPSPFSPPSSFYFNVAPGDSILGLVMDSSKCIRYKILIDDVVSNGRIELPILRIEKTFGNILNDRCYFFQKRVLLQAAEIIQ